MFYLSKQKILQQNLLFFHEDYPNNFRNIVLNDENLKFKISSAEFVNILEKLIVSADITMENSPMNCIRIESAYKLLHLFQQILIA